MALIVEDGSIVPGANTYVTDAEYVAYAKARGQSIGEGGSAREVQLIRAMDYIESFRKRFQGDKVRFDQPLQFPRSNVYIDDYFSDYTTIPKELKNAQMEAGILLNATDILKSGSIQNIQKEKLDVLEVSYFDGGSFESVRTDTIDIFLNILLINGGNSGINARVVRV
jgi:hypothetical protein